MNRKLCIWSCIMARIVTVASLLGLVVLCRVAATENPSDSTLSLTAPHYLKSGPSLITAPAPQSTSEEDKNDVITHWVEEYFNQTPMSEDILKLVEGKVHLIHHNGYETV